MSNALPSSFYVKKEIQKKHKLLTYWLVYSLCGILRIQIEILQQNGLT